MDIKKMLKQAQQMQTRLQEEMEQLTVEASAGGGMVTARMNGKKQLLCVEIKPGAIDPGDLEMLQDLVVAAVNEACRKVDEAVASRVGNLAGMMGLPGIF
ncbi:MAG: YbaB/EbfC family nucleoid-associated protein [Acidobacteriota bacterium]